MEFNFQPIQIKPIKIDLHIGKKDSMDSKYLPIKKPKTSVDFVMYENAEDLAKVIDISKDNDVIVNGSFIFGDFIEALMVEKELYAEKMVISTLSMGYENVDSLRNLIDWGLIEELDLIISGFHYAQKRHTIVDYTYERLDIEDRFQLAVADCHTKICMFNTVCGKHIVIKGSANLSSSDCVEEFSIFDDKERFDFYMNYHNFIIETFKTVKKPLRGKLLWESITNRPTLPDTIVKALYKEAKKSKRKKKDMYQSVINGKAKEE